MNFANVRGFGEFEFWFAIIKIVVIIGFIGIGLLLIFGLWPNATGANPGEFIENFALTVSPALPLAYWQLLSHSVASN